MKHPVSYVTHRSERRLRLIYVLIDLVSTNLAWVLFDIARYRMLPSAYTGHTSLESFMLSPTVMAGQLLFPLMMMGLYWLSGYYSDIYRRSRLSEALTTAASATLGSLAILLVALLNDLTSDRATDYRLIALLFGTLFVIVYLPRMAVTSYIMRRLRDRSLRQPALVVLHSRATGEEQVPTPPSMGLEVMARLKAMPDGRLTDLNGDDTDVAALCLKHGIRYVILIPDGSSRDGMDAMMGCVAELYRATDARILVSPSVDDIVSRRYSPSVSWPAGRRTTPANIDAEPLTDISRPALGTATMNLKRAGDVVIAGLALAVTSPIILLLGLCVKLDSQGPMFYRQTRVGRRGRSFNIIKLRTMRHDAESHGPSLSVEGDPRITRVGHLLRKYRLDELPQFWNVIRGDMSLVGPRPEREYFVAQLLQREPAYTLVHQVRPGITSLGMVKYGYASNIDGMLDRLRYDLLYIENIGFALDLKIIFYTFHTVITGKGL